MNCKITNWLFHSKWFSHGSVWYIWTHLLCICSPWQWFFSTIHHNECLSL